MMVGLRGSGKTTSTAKLGMMLKGDAGQKVMMASLERQPPRRAGTARVLGERSRCHPADRNGQQPVEIATRALQSAKLQAVDVLMLDTAGQLHVDQQLMDEMQAVAHIANPKEVLLVVDAPDRAGRGQRRAGLTAQVP